MERGQHIAIMGSNWTGLPLFTTLDPQSHNSNSGSMFVPAAAAFVLAVGVAAFFNKGKGSCETREPPVLGSKIPLFGHLIGMLRWQVGYMQMLR